MIVTLYTRAGCTLCDEVKNDLLELQNERPHQLAVIDVDQDPLLAQKFGEKVPVVMVGPYRLYAPFTRQDIQVALNAASERNAALEEDDEKKYLKRKNKERSFSRLEKISYWFTKHYLLVSNLFMFLYVGLPFLAPIFMKLQIPAPARMIYMVYTPLCHQLAFRSFFLFGRQWYYPRELAGIEGVDTYEQVSGLRSIDVFAARDFTGNEELGFKVALCQRDIALYGSFFLFGIIYAISGRRIKSLRWYYWLLIGIVPIGLDGFSQLPGIAAGYLPAWVPIRESQPVLRLLTGTLFGFSTAWYILPLLEQSMLEARGAFTRKIVLVEYLEKPQI